jgi:hypothetical protein
MLPATPKLPPASVGYRHHDKICSPIASPWFRSRTMSQSSVSSSFSMKFPLDSPKTPPSSALAGWPDGHHASGSFTTTNSASASLQSLADSLSWSPLLNKRKRRLHALSISYNHFPIKAEPIHTPSSPLSINSPASSIPSISRTSSSFYASEAISDHISKSPKGASRSPVIKEKPAQIDPILARLEKKSKFCTQSARCATCGKIGRDYPRCGKCGEMWCSRDCRLQGRKKHVCRV